jgi:hypothetical protein
MKTISKVKELQLIIFCVILVLLFNITSCSTPNSGGNSDELIGSDLVAYNLMLEVCKVAKDPTDTFIISGTVSDGDSGGAIMVKSGEQISYVIVSYENGKVVCSDGEEAANYSQEYMDMFCKNDDFDAAKVNQALIDHWGIE